jgi:hypothetical protein
VVEAGNHTHKQTRGWLLPYLLHIDAMPHFGHGRWRYWLGICDDLALPDEPIPQIRFTMWPSEKRVHAPELLPEDPVDHVKRVLKPYVQKGYWWDDAWLAFVRWLLHGFGRRDLEDEVARIPEDVRNFWYEQFNLAYLLQVPMEWSSFMLEGRAGWMKGNGAKWAKSTGFFSTPMNVCTMMAQMLFAGDDRDTRLLTVCDPCCGTGNMLLPASNYSLRLYGVEIVYDLCLCAELNGWLWAPWMVYHPPEVEAMFEALSETATPAPPPIRLETNPVYVELARAYRQGELAQADFFAAIGTS